MFDPISLGLGYGGWRLGKYIYEVFHKPSAPANPRKEAEIQELTAEPIFFAVAILAKFAKADGIVTKNEIATIEEILRDIELTGEDRKKAISVFSKHKDGALTYEESLTLLAGLTERGSDFRTGLCILLLRLAHADGLDSASSRSPASRKSNPSHRSTRGASPATRAASSCRRSTRTATRSL